MYVRAYVLVRVHGSVFVDSQLLSLKSRLSLYELHGIARMDVLPWKDKGSVERTLWVFDGQMVSHANEQGQVTSESCPVKGVSLRYFCVIVFPSPKSAMKKQ